MRWEVHVCTCCFGEVGVESPDAALLKSWREVPLCHQQGMQQLHEPKPHRLLFLSAMQVCVVCVYVCACVCGMWCVCVYVCAYGVCVYVW